MCNTTKNFFRFVAVDDIEIAIVPLNGLLSPANEAPLDIAFSRDGVSWDVYEFGGWLHLCGGGTIYLKGCNAESFYKYKFKVDGGRYECHGNIMSLLYGDDFEGKVELGISCFSCLFLDCKGMTTAPELPATTLADSCYYGMFYGCTSLTKAPELPATTLAEDCYGDMFWGCTSLTTAPELPATTLAHGCYMGMFRYCKKLTTAPELPATTLADWCYAYMFKGCESLKAVTMCVDGLTDFGCVSCMLTDVSPYGVLRVSGGHADSSILGRMSAPEHWYVSVCDEADDLPGTVEECLSVMGLGMSSLGSFSGYEYDKLMVFQQMIVCRDAYLKLLGGWTPDWKNSSERKYCIVNVEGDITKWTQKTTHKVFAFPTAESMDAFYANFFEKLSFIKEYI